MKRSEKHVWRIARIAILAIAIVVSAGAVTAAHAGTDADLRAGYYFDSDAFALGGGLLTNLNHAGTWWLNPNVEVGFADNVNVVTLNGDVHYDLPVESDISWWLGAGPAVMITDPENGDSNTDLGLNLIGGMGAGHGNIRPFGQLKAIVADNSEVALMGGIRF